MLAGGLFYCNYSFAFYTQEFSTATHAFFYLVQLMSSKQLRLPELQVLC